MKTKLIPIGNSRGIRIPKPMIKEANLLDDVEIKVIEGSIIITSLGKIRNGWSEYAKELNKREEDKLIINETTNKFDDNEWNW
jgi:antitoxin MazE